ncbi:MAG TPA: hypothetical protein VL687_07520 [Methylomirabilota bacterium]|jgi:hypothetical protein|nr:hypothetical protein [Methylomirabilota bacterium]
MSRGRPRHQSSRRRMYSGRQRDLRERRSHQEWDAPGALGQDASFDGDESRELETPGWTIQLNARASAA